MISFIDVMTGHHWITGDRVTSVKWRHSFASLPVFVLENDHQTSVFVIVSWMPFLMPNQQCQNTEDKSKLHLKMNENIIS